MVVIRYVRLRKSIAWILLKGHEVKVPDIRCRHLKGRTKFEYLWEYQEGLCFYCKQPMDSKDSKTKRRASLDHVKPKSKGGKSPRNLVLACQLCNSKKGSKDINDFVK